MRGLGIGVALVLTSIGLIASASGPVPARTGGFGEMTCRQCHWDNDADDPAGRITMTGVPDFYTPGERYPITVEIAHPALAKGGFQMAARFADGTNAGLFAHADDRTEAIPDDGGRVTYIQHTRIGSAPAAKGLSRWTMTWTAPAAGAAVVFHLAGNAANGDLSPLGDFIYTASAGTRPR